MISQDQQRLIGCLLISIPTSYLMTWITKPATQLLFTCSVSIVLQFIVFRQWIIALWIQQNIVYILCKYGNRNVIGKAIFVQTFAVLFVIQMIRMYLGYGIQSIDISAIMMMQSFQYISFAFNYQDGVKKQVDQYKIIRLPPYAEYLGYVSFIPCCLVGPIFQFNDYHHYLYRTGIYKDVEPGFCIAGMRKQLKTTILSIAIYSLFISFPISKMITEQYEEFSFLLKVLYMLISIIGTRFRYYTVWGIGMLGVHATGLTYNPKKNQFGVISNDWDRISVSNIWNFEFDPDMETKFDSWNISIQKALKRYIYDRINNYEESKTEIQKKRINDIANKTKLAIYAFWHGVYPAFFIAFFHWVLWFQISQQANLLQKQSNKFNKWRKKLKYVELVVINYFVGYFGVCYQLMTLQKIHLFLKASFYVPLAITYILNILVVRLKLFRSTKKIGSEGVEQNIEVKNKKSIQKKQQ